MTRLSASFFALDTVAVARALLGQRLVRVLNGQRLSGLICETEAYRGSDDRASHAFRRTPRSAIMYGAPGFAYVYLIYGVHHCLNVVTELDGHPGAALIRAILPQEGREIMRGHRSGAPDHYLADGPGKLCQALAITQAQNGVDLTRSSALFVEVATSVPPAEVTATPRIRVRGDMTARNRPWRYLWKPTHQSSAPNQLPNNLQLRCM